MPTDFDPLLQKLEEIDNLAKTEWNDGGDLYNKLILIKPLCENRIKSVYIYLLPQNDLTQLQSHLINLSSYLTSYKPGNATQVTQLINTINAIIPIVLKVPTVGDGETSAILAKIIDDFNQRNAAVISQITREKEELTEEVEALKKTISVLSGEVAKERADVISLTAEFQKQFSDAQEKRSSDFADAQKDRDNKFASREAERSSAFENQKNTVEDSANLTLGEIEEIKDLSSRLI